MSGAIHWRGRALPFHPGETVASALMRAGVMNFGTTATGQASALFCGIGQCQSCIVRADGRVTEACLLPCHDGLRVAPVAGDENA